MNDDISAYERQGFGAAMAPKAPYGLLIVDLVNGFADPAVFGGGNIPEAIARTVGLLAHARQLAGGPQPHRVRRRRRRPQHLHAQGARHADLEGSGPQQRHRAAARARFRGAGGAQDGAFRVLRHQPGRLAVTARVQTLLVAGAVTSGCVRASVVDAMQYGFRPLVVSDCVGDRAIGPHEANLFDMRQKYATVLTRDEALRATRA